MYPVGSNAINDRTIGESAARFHVSTLNGSGKMSSMPGRSDEMAPFRASMLPMQLVQFALISWWSRNSPPAAS